MVRYGRRTDSQRVIIIASLEWGAKEWSDGFCRSSQGQR
jgi:hypothetical protein